MSGGEGNTWKAWLEPVSATAKGHRRAPGLREERTRQSFWDEAPCEPASKGEFRSVGRGGILEKRNSNGWSSPETGFGERGATRPPFREHGGCAGKVREGRRDAQAAVRLCRTLATTSGCAHEDRGQGGTRSELAKLEPLRELKGRGHWSN